MSKRERHRAKRVQHRPHPLISNGAWVPMRGQRRYKCHFVIPNASEAVDLIKAGYSPADLLRHYGLSVPSGAVITWDDLRFHPVDADHRPLTSDWREVTNEQN